MRECRCTPLQVARYRSRLSGPLRDRLDLTVEVPALAPQMFSATASAESSACVRARVVDARARQRERYRDSPVTTNAELTPSLMRASCALDRRCEGLLDQAVRRMGLSARGYDRVRKVARTIADLDGAECISAEHIAEALQFRVSI